MFDDHPLQKLVQQLIGLSEEKRQLLRYADLPGLLHAALDDFWRWSKASIFHTEDARKILTTHSGPMGVCKLFEALDVDSLVAVKGALMYLALNESVLGDVSDVKLSEMRFFRDDDGDGDDRVEVVGKLVG